MNYCPIAEDAMPPQLIWGHEKEKRALGLYIKKKKKKQNKNHEKLSIEIKWTHCKHIMALLGSQS